MSSTDSAISTGELATLLESKAAKLRAGDGDREDVVREVMGLLAGEPYVRERSQVYEDGRTSFGRDVAGDGTALFLPDDVDDDAGEA